MKTLAMTTGALVFAILAACASTTPPAELRTARASYQKLADSAAATIAPADVYESKKALARAEMAFEDDGDSPEARDLAYVADRKAIVARARANAVVSLEQKRDALAELEKWKEERAQASLEELGETNERLSQTEARPGSERRARTGSEERTAAALAAIEGLSAKPEARGLVLTIDGAVLFATGKSTLMATAQQRLNDVIKAVKDDARPILIVGHTDSAGGDDDNQRLSQERAAAVRSYMTAQGIPPGRIRAEGMGETMPIADNTSAEGRATNRRVEIILEGSSADTPARPGTGLPRSDKDKEPSPQPGTGIVE